MPAWHRIVDCGTRKEGGRAPKGLITRPAMRRHIAVALSAKAVSPDCTLGQRAKYDAKRLPGSRTKTLPASVIGNVTTPDYLSSGQKWRMDRRKGWGGVNAPHEALSKKRDVHHGTVTRRIVITTPESDPGRGGRVAVEAMIFGRIEACGSRFFASIAGMRMNAMSGGSPSLPFQSTMRCVCPRSSRRFCKAG
jgi:hypothetical protein